MVRIEEGVSLASLGSFHIGGAARYVAYPKTDEDMREAIAFAAERAVPLLVVGGGTNFLFPDTGFPGLVVHPSALRCEVSGTTLVADAGLPMKDLLETAATHGLSGLEWAGGLPGTVGGAVRGNAGAFGGETKDSVAWVESIAVSTGNIVRRTAAECAFGYRTSVWKTNGGTEIILRAAFDLRPGDVAVIRAAAEEKARYRTERHPMEYPNIGSVFKNVPVASAPGSLVDFAEKAIKQDPFPVIPAAFLISEARLKGLRRGDAMVSEKHPNFVVNIGNATAEDVRALVRDIQLRIRDRFHIELEEEIIVLHA